MSKIPEIAEMFGKEVGEVFKIRLKTGAICEAKFSTSKGLLYQDRLGSWSWARLVLNDLLTGEAEIIEKVA
ncbi:hypothetical protein [Selenomonas ruminantium]|uniref:Uncharacterized protein n=1 Tax=Selenomonas ruminantium TaxID=971 RepID=A0A1H0P5K2_SELRU|nr:hypothetical protein [Selenomonas ruminantium]MBR1696425.1 hypothetical protein [Selenomonas sp.]SDO99960.1 hypothetical protein SAMN05216366_104110 [Selenomonas ruminantium]